MLIDRFHHCLTAPLSKTSKAQARFWFGMSLMVALIYGFLGLQQAFSGDYVVQDDARQHVFWMQRFLDPDLFPQDWIADYFQSVAPAGYRWVYQAAASLGVNPMVFNKLLPTVLALVTTGYGFGLCLKLFPIPAAGFTATLFLNQLLWSKDDLISATPRAFFYPLFLAFLYYLLRRSLWPCLIALGLQCLFYPQTALLSCATLCVRLLGWTGKKLRFSRDRGDIQFAIAGLCLTVILLLPFILTTSEFGPIITLAEAQQMPEFSPNGRASFFLTTIPDIFGLSTNAAAFCPMS
ncbi:MAG: hypothetical protein QNJ46_28865 [Leptolyngbyaceae cyanobacterium MO_188.B28]|nr:hypothetical protein [Leptolyngbyaceae cyanobacterium MO_188.B28]